MKNKPDLKKHVQFDRSRKGCGIGCMSIGCMGVIGIVMMLCIAGYYSVFHSSLPLRLIEAAIEEDGDVEIEGLTGNLSDGFSADEIKFKTIDDRWSNLTDIKFEYEGDMSIFGTDRFVIKNMSVGGGTIYADWDPDQNEIDIDPDFGEEIGEEFAEIDDELRDELGQSPQLVELRIDLVSVANLKIVNPATQLEITIDEMKFEGFHWYKGELQSLGKLLVRSSQMDLDTVPSVEYAEMKNSERFEGTLRAEADHRLKTDVPFVFDFGVNHELDVSIKSELFDGRLQVVQSPDESTLKCLDFSPTDFIDLKTGVVLPSNINLKLGFDKNKKKKRKKGPTHVNKDGTLDLGKTRFSNLRVKQIEDGPNCLIATGNVNGETVLASIFIDGPYSLSWRVSLDSEANDSPEKLWAQTLYGLDFEALSEEQQTAVRASIREPEPETENDPDQNLLAEQESTDNDDQPAVEE